MHLAQKRGGHALLLELVGLDLTLRPGAEIELVGAGVRREDVVQDRVRVEEVDGRPDENRKNVR
jgi:hypothetical protein